MIGCFSIEINFYETIFKMYLLLIMCLVVNCMYQLTFGSLKGDSNIDENIDVLCIHSYVLCFMYFRYTYNFEEMNEIIAVGQ